MEALYSSSQQPAFCSVLSSSKASLLRFLEGFVLSRTVLSTKGQIWTLPRTPRIPPSSAQMDLDWSGNAPPPNCKKHLPAPKARLECTATGLSGLDTDWRPGRGTTAQPCNTRNTFDLIGGPVPLNNPESQVEPKKWQTEAQALLSQKKTTETDQLTQMGRARLIRGKQTTMPAFLAVRPFDDNVAERLRGENPYRLNECAAGASVADVQGEHSLRARGSAPDNTTCPSEEDEFSLVGFRRSGQSYLDGLGVSILASRE